MNTQEKVREAIEKLNHIYGRGAVGEIRQYLDGRIEFWRTPFNCRPEKRTARIDGKTLRALGHQTQLT